MTSLDFSPGLLIKAVTRQDVEAVEHIVSSNKRNFIWWFELRHRRTEDTALHVAIRTQCIPIIKILCESCHEKRDQGRLTCVRCRQIMELANNMGKRALHEAATLCNVQIIQYLLDIGAEVDPLKSGDWTPLMLVSAKNGFNAAKSAELLLKKGANPLLTNKDGWTPLHLACRTGNFELVRTLLKNSTAAAVSTSSNGRTPMHVACLHGHRNIVEELCRTPYSILDPVDACGLTPLHETIRGGHIALFRLLVDKGADLMKTDHMELTCLHIAASSDRSRIIEILVLELGFNVNEATVTGGLTPLHCAVRASHIDAVRTLINLGANPDVQDARGRKGVDFIYGCDVQAMMQILGAKLNDMDEPANS